MVSEEHQHASGNGHGHEHDFRSASRKSLWIAFALISSYMLAEENSTDGCEENHHIAHA